MAPVRGAATGPCLLEPLKDVGRATAPWLPNPVARTNGLASLTTACQDLSRPVSSLAFFAFRDRLNSHWGRRCNHNAPKPSPAEDRAPKDWVSTQWMINPRSPCSGPLFFYAVRPGFLNESFPVPYLIAVLDLGQLPSAVDHVSPSPSLVSNIVSIGYGLYTVLQILLFLLSVIVIAN